MEKGSFRMPELNNDISKIKTLLNELATSMNE